MTITQGYCKLWSFIFLKPIHNWFSSIEETSSKINIVSTLINLTNQTNMSQSPGLFGFQPKTFSCAFLGSSTKIHVKHPRAKRRIFLQPCRQSSLADDNRHRRSEQLPWYEKTVFRRHQQGNISRHLRTRRNLLSEWVSTQSHRVEWHKLGSGQGQTTAIYKN